MPATCNDDYEPNGDLPRAAAPRIGQECSGGTKDGIIAGDGDVDVYRTGVCTLGLAARALTPWVELETTALLRVCLIPMCAIGSTNVYAEAEGCYENEPGDGKLPDGELIVWKVRTESGFRGCCRIGAGRVTAKFDCPRFSTTFDTFYWVDGGDSLLGAGSCPSYRLTYALE